MLLIIKGHHSLQDGVSGMVVTAASSEEYSKDYFIPSKDIKFAQ